MPVIYIILLSVYQLPAHCSVYCLPICPLLFLSVNFLPKDLCQNANHYTVRMKVNSFKSLLTIVCFSSACLIITCKYTSVNLSLSLSVCHLSVCLCVSLTFLSRVEEMLAQIAAENALLENAALLQLAARGPTQDKAPEKGDELPVLAEHRFGRLRRRLRWGCAVPAGEVVGVGQRGGVGMRAPAARA